MSCDSTSSTYLALRSVLFWPLRLLGTAALRLTTLLLALHAASLQARTQQDSAPTPRRQPTPPDYTEDLQAELLGPNDDAWFNYLDDPFVQATCIHHLRRCYDLDSHRHTHS